MEVLINLKSVSIEHMTRRLYPVMVPLIRLEGLNLYDARCVVYGKLTIGGLIQDIANKYLNFQTFFFKHSLCGLYSHVHYNCAFRRIRSWLSHTFQVLKEIEINKMGLHF